MITLREILKLRTDIFEHSKVKLVRHKDSREEYRELIKHKQGLLEYQKVQGKDVFKGCDYIISFVGKERKRSIFLGIFKVNGAEYREGKYFYDLEPIQGFDDLIDRLVIDWGNNAIAWNQWYHLQEKEVIEILPKGYLGSFPGLLSFVLTYDELQTLINNPEANQDWKNHLSAVNGIYLILDVHTGRQYIGAAYGVNGIWQRWSDYARTHTGGNREFVNLFEQDANYQRHFRYSILQSLPSNITQKEIVETEALYKQKLGSRAHGLNLN